jgi:hypothetical protein
MRSVIAEKTEKHCAHAVAWGEETYLNNCRLWFGRAECSQPLQVFMGVDSVWMHETGLECNQRLPRKLSVKVTTAVGTWHRTSCSVPQFSRKTTDSFWVLFRVFGLIQHEQSPSIAKTHCGANQRQPFSGCPSSCKITEVMPNVGNFSIISATAGPFRPLFRDSALIYHQ